MKKYSLYLILFLMFTVGDRVFSQGISINENGAVADPSAMLEIQSTNKGVLIPRMTTGQRTGISNPASGLLVFDSTTQSFWFYSVSAWIELTDATTNWQTSGNNIYYTSGNVGIGDATPAALLTVGNGGKFQVESTRGNLTFTDDSASIKFPSSIGGNTPMMYLFNSGTQNADRMVLGHSPGFPKWGLEYHDTSDVFYFRTSAARKFAFELGSGHLGIGTDDPSFPIDFVGRMRIRSSGTQSNSPGIWFAALDNEFDRAFLGMSEPDSTLGIWSQHLSTWAIEFEVMREPRIGVNIQPGSPPRSEVHLVHTNLGGSNDGVRIQNEGPNGEYWNLYTSNATGDLEFYNSGIKRSTIDDVSGVYTAVSDSRLKTNINSLQAVLPAVMKLQPRTYQFTNKPNNRNYTGFLAQELEQVFPQFVFYGGDDQVTYSVDYASMSVIALKAIQEQQVQIEELKREIESLKSKSSLHLQN